MRGYIGLGKPLAEVGDVIYLLCGSAAPMILRPEGDYYLLVGDCYIHQIMNGEALAWPGVEDVELVLDQKDRGQHLATSYYFCLTARDPLRSLLMEVNVYHVF
jgi:hypothetical protein